MPYSSMISHYHLPRMREMGIIYWCNTVGTLGISLVAIFVPIFLLKSGFSFRAVLGYLVVQQLLAAITQYPISRLFKYVHPHYMLGAGTLLCAIYFGLLSTLHTQHWPLFLLAFVWALNRSTYWLAFHYIFGHVRGHKVAAQQIAGFEALAILASTLAPAIGGVIATLFGITSSYILAIALLAAAVLPLLSVTNEPPHAVTKMPWREVKAMWRDMLANCSNGIVLTAELSIWPLLVFTFVGSYASIGLLSAVVALSSMVLTLFVGRQQSSQGKRYIKRGLATYSLTSVGRAVAQTTTQAFGLNLFAGIGRSLYVTPFMNRFYTNSDGPYRLGYLTAMETAFTVASAGFLTVLLMLSFIVSMKAALAIGLGLVAICALGVRLIR